MKRGFTLASVIVFGFLGLMFMSLVMDMIGRTQVQQTQDQGSALAYDFAHRALARARLTLANNPSWGKAGESLVVAGDEPPSQGAIHFSNSDPYYSTNNLDGTSTVKGYGDFAVPQSSCYLVAEGRYLGVTRRLACVLSQPGFKYALSSSGSLVTKGSFYVGALTNPGAAADVNSLAFQQALLPSDLAANSSANPSLNLQGSPVVITGSVITPGTASLGSGVTVQGQVENGHDPVSLPVIDISSYDPKNQTLVNNLGSTYSGDPLEGYVRAAGDLTAPSGLTLNEAIVYVNGNLVVNGPLSGVGAIFVKGTTTLTTTSLSSLKQLAVVSGGDVVVTGQGKSSSVLVGLLYSQGNLSLKDVTVVGGVVAAGDSSKVATLDNVNVFRNPAGVQFSFEVGFTGITSVQVNTGGAGGGQITVPLRLGYSHPADFLDSQGKSSFVKDGDGNWTLTKAQVATYWDIPGTTTAEDVLNKLKTSGTLNTMGQAVDTVTSQTDVVQRGQINLDLNQFLRLSDRLKITYIHSL